MASGKGGGGKEKGGGAEKPHKKEESFYEHAKHAVTDAIYGKPKQKPVEKHQTAGKSSPVEKHQTAGTSNPVEKHQTAGKSSPVEKHQTAGKSSPVEKHQTAGKASPVEKHQTAGKSSPVEKHQTAGNPTEKYPAAEKALKAPELKTQKPDRTTEKSAEKGLNFSQLKQDATKVFNNVTRPLEQTLRTVGRELHKTEKVVEDALLHRHPEKRQPRQMTAEQAKHEHNITTMNPDERARLKLYKAEDPNTHILYNYNRKGLLVDAETLNGQHRHIQYRGDSKDPAAFKITQNGSEGKPLAEGKVDNSQRIQVDQRTGDIRVDSKQKTSDGKTQILEEHYSADGSHSKIKSQNGVRLSKEIYTQSSDEFKKTSTIEFRYHDDKNHLVPPEKVDARTKCTATQTDEQGTVRHQFTFESANHLKEWKPKTQTDITKLTKDAEGVSHQKSVTFDLSSGKRAISETDITITADKTGTSQHTDTYAIANGKTKTKVSSSDVTQTTRGTVTTQTSDNFEYVNGKAQKVSHSKESLDTTNGSSSSENFIYRDGKIVAKDFTRKDVADSGETTVTTTAVRNEKIAQHRQARFDDKGQPVSLMTTEGQHTYEVKFGKDGKVETNQGKPGILKDGKPLLKDGMPDIDKKNAQVELKSISLDAGRYMQDTHQRFDVRARVKIDQADGMQTEEANKKAVSDRAKAGTREFTVNGTTHKCDSAGRIVEQTRDNVTVTVSYDGTSITPQHVSIKPPGNVDDGEFSADKLRQLQLNQTTGDLLVTQRNNSGYKVWEDRFAAGDNLASRTAYTYQSADHQSTTTPDKIDPTQTVTARTTNREGKVTDHYVFADTKHMVAHNADQHIQFDAKTGEATEMVMRVKAQGGGDSLLEYTLSNGKIRSARQDGQVIKTLPPDAAARVEAYLKGMQEQCYPKEAPGRAGAKEEDSKESADHDAASTSNKTQQAPRTFSDEEKDQLRQKALEVHRLAGFDNYVFTYADSNGIKQVLETLKTQDEIDEFKRQYKAATNSDLEEQLSSCRDFKGYGAYHLQALLTADESSKTACEIRCAMEEYQARGPEGRSKWECAAYLRKTLSHLDDDQMKRVEKSYAHLYPDQGSIHGSILSSELPQEIKDCVPYYARGNNNLTERDRLKMADIAVEAKNLEMFKEVTAQFDDKTRETYNSNTERQNKLSDAFSGRQLQQARAVAQDGVNLIAQEIRDNTGMLTTNRSAVRMALEKLTDDQRHRYEEGRDLEGKVNLTADQEKSVRLYQSLHAAITATGIRSAEIRGLEDSVVIKGGGLVSEVSKGDGIYVSGVQEQLDKIANMNEQDWQKLHDYVKGTRGKAHPEYRQQLEMAMRDMKGVRIGEAEINKILSLYDRKIGAETFTASKLEGQKDILDALASQRGLYNDRGAALEAVSRMTPAEQQRYRTDSEFRQKIDNELQHFTQVLNKDAYNQAHRMLTMYQHDDAGVFSQFRTLSNLSASERQAFLSDAASVKKLQDSINQITDGDSKQSAQRMLNQLNSGQPPEMMDVFSKLAARRSEWFGDPHKTVDIMEQAFREDPKLLSRIQNPITEEDKQMAAHFKELTNAAFGSGKNYGQELINSKDGRLALEQKLEMNKHVLYTDRQGIINDLASASETEKQLLKDRNSALRKQVDAEMKTWCRLFNGAEERDRGQQQVVDKIIATGKVEEHDRLRAYIVDVGNTSKIMELMRTATPDQLDKLCADYEKTYHRDLRVDLKEKLGKGDCSEALNLLYRPTTSEDLYRHLLNQYLDTRSGFGSAFADNVGHSGTGYQLDNDINHITAMVAEAHRSGKPLSPEQERVLLGNINNSVELFTKDLSNFKESKSACAEYTAQGVMAALTVLGAVATAGGSLVAEGGIYAGMETAAVGAETVAGLETVAVGAETVAGLETVAGVETVAGLETVETLSNGSRALNYLRNGIEFVNSARGNALMNTGLQMSMMGKDYDLSSVPGDLVSGFAQGKIFEVFSGPRVLGLLKLGDGAALRTSENACATLLKEEGYGLTRTLTTEEGKKAFQSCLRREMANHVRESWLLGGGKELTPNAIRAASGKALREALEVELKQTAGRAGSDELQKISRHELDRRVKQELEKIVEAKVGGGALKEMEKDVAAQVRAGCSRFTPEKVIERRIEQAMTNHLAEVASSNCEKVIARSFLEASQSQTKGLVKGLIEYSFENSRLLRYTRGMAVSLSGAGVGGTASGVMEGLVHWDASKSVEENMNAMREHIVGSVYSSILGAAQMHPLGMMAHHYQAYMSRPGTHVLAAHESTNGTYHDLKSGMRGFTEYSGGQTISEAERVVSIRDAEGRQSRITRNTAGQITELERSTEHGAERWTRLDSGLFRLETARATGEIQKEIQVEKDGRTIFKGGDGSQDVHHIDGTIEHIEPNGKSHFVAINERVQRQKFENILALKVNDPALHARMRTDMDVLTERLITAGHNRNELAKVYFEANQLLLEAARPDLPAETRLHLQRTTEEAIWLAAHPTLVSQGYNPTCPIASAESRAWNQRPAETMRMVRELAITGEFVCPDRTRIKPFTAGGDNIFLLDAEARSHYEGPMDRVDGRRLGTSQMLQTLMVSAAYADHQYYNGEQIGAGNIGYIDNHVVDMRTNPPRVLSTEAGPQMYPSDVRRAYEKLTGQTEDFVLLNRRYQDSLNVDPSFTFNSPEELGAKLFGNQKRNKLPISIQLHTAHEPFYTDSGAHRSNGQTGEHMLNILKVEIVTDTNDKRSLREISPEELFDPHSGKLKVKPEDIVVSVTNQWDKSVNHLTKRIPLAELYRATTNPLDTSNLRSLEQEIAREPNNLGKQLDLLRYKNSFEKHRLELEESAAKHPSGREVKELALLKPATDCVSTEKLIEEIDKLTELKMKEIAARPGALAKPTKEDVAMLDKAQALLKAAKEDLTHREELLKSTPTKELLESSAASTSKQTEVVDEAPGAARGRANRRKESEQLEKLIERVTDIETKLEEKRTDCLKDTKVPDTLSEFGFEVKLAQTISESSEKDHIVAAFIDLNNFKNVNVYHSMEMGDKALRVWGAEAAKVLSRYNIDPTQALGHFGGDEFGILLKNCREYQQVLDEIMSIRVGCKPQSSDPTRQRDCDFVILEKGEAFHHTAYKTELANGLPIVTEHASPVISASLGAVEWKPQMSAEDVLQTADKVMFEKKPIVKAQLAAGGDAVINPFSDKVEATYNTPLSDHLQLYRRLAGEQKEFSLAGMTTEQVRDYCRRELEDRQRLFFDLLNKHPHTKILDRVKSKEILEKFIISADQRKPGPDGVVEPPFTIIRLAIDNFKSVNDTMESHAKGDRVLKEVGAFLRGLKIKAKAEDGDQPLVDFVGSLGGTSPFLIVRDPNHVQEILKKCDEFFLEVSREKPDPERLDSFENKQPGNIAVGLSAGALQWKPGMDIEMLLNMAEAKADQVQEEHIFQGRHTRRKPEGQPSELEPGQVDRRKARKSDEAPPEVSLARNSDHHKKTNGNVPDAPVGKWTYADVDTTRRTVTSDYTDNQMRVREAIYKEETIDGKNSREVIGYKNVAPFFQQKTVDEFAKATEPLLTWERGDTKSLEARRSAAETLINRFLEDQNLPPIELQASRETDIELVEKKGRALYRDGLGKVAVRTSDLLNVGDPTFIAALYHELVHVEQDVAMIRASALDVVHSNKARSGNSSTAMDGAVHADRGSAVDGSEHSNNDSAVDYETNHVRRRYSATRGHMRAWNAMEQHTKEQRQFGSWFDKVLTQDGSRTWINERRNTSQADLLAHDAEYRRADWLRDSFRTGEAGNKFRTFRESESNLDARVERLANLIDVDDTYFNGNEARFLKKLSSDANERQKIYGYDPLKAEFDQRDRLFMELLTKDRLFADKVEHGARSEWIPLYAKHVQKLTAQIETEIKGLDRDAPDYEKTLRELLNKRSAIPEAPRTLQLLSRWELKGLLHGMTERDFEPVSGYFDHYWNKSLAEHLHLVLENAKNQKDRIDYSKTMRHGGEQEAYATMPIVERAAIDRLFVLRQKDGEIPTSNDKTELLRERNNAINADNGLIYSKDHPFKQDLSQTETEALRLQAGGAAASEHIIGWLTECLARAGDHILTVNPDLPRLKNAEDNMSQLIRAARENISEQLPDLLPDGPAGQQRFFAQKFMQNALESHPALLEMYRAATDAHQQYKETYAEELVKVRRHNAEFLNQALTELTMLCDAPRLEIFTTEKGSVNAAYQLGTTHVLVTDVALSGRLPMEKLIADISHEVSHNMQNALVVRHLANELHIATHPSKEEIKLLQNEYQQRVNQPLDESYLVEALKGNRNIAAGDAQRAEALMSSFSQVQEGSDLRNELHLVDWAISKIDSYYGAGALLANALSGGGDKMIEELIPESTVAYLLPEDHGELLKAAKVYQRGGEEWKVLEVELRNSWRKKLVERREVCQSALDEHDRLYAGWEHEKEASAFAELVLRRVRATTKDRWKDIHYDMDNLKNYDADKKA